VTVGVLFVVWGGVLGLNVFYATGLQTNLNKSDEGNNRSENGTGNTSHTACHETMKRDHVTSRCYIPCEDWDWQTKSEKGLDSASAYITLFIYAVCLIVTSITWIKLKHLWSFPLTTPFYVIVANATLGLFFNINYLFTRKAFCSDKDLLRSMDNPTPFCATTGAIYQYMFIAGSFWLLFSFGNLWWIIVFPTKGKLLFENKQRIHIIQTSIALIAPGIPVAALFLSNGHYAQTPMVPHNCFPSTFSSWFYSSGIPMQLFCCITCTLLVWTCDSLLKKGWKRSSLTTGGLSSGCQTTNNGSLYILHRRLAVLLISYFIIFYFFMVVYVIVFHNGPLITNAFEQYVRCADSTPEADCLDLFRKQLKALSELMLIADLAIFAEFIVGPLMFIFAYKDVRELWFSILTCGLYWRKSEKFHGNTIKSALPK
jgi:hypothetical protein